jgi:hypothetical protein
MGENCVFETLLSVSECLMLKIHLHIQFVCAHMYLPVDCWLLGCDAV